MQPLLFELFELLVVPIDHDILIVLVPELPREPFVDRIIAELKSPLLHHLIDFGDHPDATAGPTPSLLVMHAFKPDVVPRGLMLEARRVKVDIQHVAVKGSLARGRWDDLIVVVAKLARIIAVGIGVPAACRLSHTL